jgi:hypothetical protein
MYIDGLSDIVPLLFLPNPSAPSDVKRFIAKDTKKLCLSPAWLHPPRFKPVVVNDVYNSNGKL